MYSEIEKIICERKASHGKCEFLVFGYRAATRFHNFLMMEHDMDQNENIEGSSFMGRKIEVNHKINPNEIRGV